MAHLPARQLRTFKLTMLTRGQLGAVSDELNLCGMTEALEVAADLLASIALWEDVHPITSTPSELLQQSLARVRHNRRS